MTDWITIANDHLSAAINPLGAELSSLPLARRVRVVRQVVSTSYEQKGSYSGSCLYLVRVFFTWRIRYRAHSRWDFLTVLVFFSQLRQVLTDTPVVNRRLVAAEVSR